MILSLVCSAMKKRNFRFEKDNEQSRTSILLSLLCSWRNERLSKFRCRIDFHWLGSKIIRSSSVIHLKAAHAQFNRKSDIPGPRIGPFQGRSLHYRWSRGTKTLGTRVDNEASQEHAQVFGIVWTRITIVPRVLVPLDHRSWNERPWKDPILSPEIADFRLSCACLAFKWMTNKLLGILLPAICTVFQTNQYRSCYGTFESCSFRQARAVRNEDSRYEIGQEVIRAFCKFDVTLPCFHVTCTSIAEQTHGRIEPFCYFALL